MKLGQLFGYNWLARRVERMGKVRLRSGDYRPSGIFGHIVASALRYAGAYIAVFAGNRVHEFSNTFGTESPEIRPNRFAGDCSSRYLATTCEMKGTKTAVVFRTRSPFENRVAEPNWGGGLRCFLPK